MSLQNYDDLNDMQLDALCEIGNIGSGNVATALSSMLERPVDISVPKIKILDYEEVVESLGGPEELLVGLFLSLSGDVTGMIMFLLNKNFANMVMGTLLGTTDFEEGSGMEEMGESAIKEVGNIMAASYANAIAALTGLKIDVSVPEMCADMAGAIMSVPAIYYANIGDKIISIEDQFGQDDIHAASHILMIPEMDSLQKIMSSLGLGE